MYIKPFTLERYFAKYEFPAPYLLSCSDYEGNNFRIGLARKNMPEALERLSQYLRVSY